jgi:hypothetical protein
MSNENCYQERSQTRRESKFHWERYQSLKRKTEIKKLLAKKKILKSKCEIVVTQKYKN